MVRKLFTGAFALTAFVAATGFVPADAPAADSSPAAVVKDFSCFVPASIAGVNLLTDEKTQKVTTSSGNHKATCHFVYPEGTEPTANINLDGFTCLTDVGATTDTRFVANKAGRATLTCQVKG